MINTSDNEIEYIDLLNDNFRENLKKLSVDQLKAIDLNAVQKFVKQKEEEYKKDNEELRGYYDFHKKNINNRNIFGYVENQNKMVDKVSEIKKKYGIYIYDRDDLDKLPQDFEGNRILGQKKIYKQYEFIRKKYHTKQDFDSLFNKENLIAIFYPFGYEIAHCKLGGEWKALSLSDILNRMRGEIDRSITSEYLKDNKRKSFFAGNIKFSFIRYFIGLKYLLIAAKQYNDTENIAEIQGTIEYLFDGIKKIDAIIKSDDDKISQEILNAIK